MVRTFLRIAFWVFSIIGIFLMLASFILFVLSINSYITSTGIASSESEYKVSYNEVENAVKSRNASDNRDIYKKPQEDTQSIPELYEKPQDEEEQLINDIRKSIKARGIGFYEAYLEQLRQFMKQSISDKNVRIEYFKGLKAIVELAPVQDINTYIEEYHRRFMEKYQDYLNEKVKHRELAIIFLSVGFACFITSLMFSMVVALLSIERNTSEILSQIKSFIRNANNLGIILFLLAFLPSCYKPSPEKLHERCKDLISSSEYIKALKFCEEACQRKIKDACLKQAFLLDRYIQGGASRALEIYKSLCDDGVGEACFLAGNIYSTGRSDVKKNKEKALDMYKKGCEHGWKEACEGYGSSKRNDQEKSTIVYESPSTLGESKEDSLIYETVADYHKAVEEERIYDALDFYVSYRKHQIKLDKLKQIGEGTEYYVIEEVRPLRYYDGGNKADVYVRVRQKPVYSSQEQVWEGVWIMEKENGEWKIVRTPGRRIR